MKTFNESDLITWSNRHEAKIGAKGYFGHSIAYLKANIKANHVYELINISDDFSDCFNCSISGDIRSYDFFLPIEAVKEEKTYRPCKTVQELYELVGNSKNKINEKECIYWLVGGTVIHFRDKQFKKERYEIITSIRTYDNASPIISIAATATYELDDLFDNYEIEKDGEWLPFGIEE